MGKKTIKGVCCICGQFGDLHYDHVPPQAAYNKSTAVQYVWNERTTKSKVKGKPIQGGVGANTLCQSCNNNTGSWYGGEYINWARTFFRLMADWKQHGLESGSVCLLNVRPFNFLKQVVTCFLSTAGRDSGAVFAGKNPELALFVLDKEATELPPRYRFFLNLYVPSQPRTQLRRFPLAGKITVSHDDKTITPLNAAVFSEIAHPPFQLLMTDGMPYSDAMEITQFKQYGYNQTVNVELTLRLIESSSPFPGAN